MKDTYAFYVKPGPLRDALDAQITEYGIKHKLPKPLASPAIVELLAKALGIEEQDEQVIEPKPEARHQTKGNNEEQIEVVGWYIVPKERPRS